MRDGFAAKKLGLTAEAADTGIRVTAEKMKAANRKSRVTFYYLPAEATGTLGKLSSQWLWRLTRHRQRATVGQFADLRFA